MSQLICHDVSVGYDGCVITEHLNITINSGDYLCIVGENGAGKSTLIKTLLHLKTPLKGKIELGEGLKPSDIGYLPQQTVVQKDFPASVWEIVLSGTLNRCAWRPFYTRKEKNAARDAMERLGITNLYRRCYRELSGGQQQRVLLARALCATEKMVLLDEPVAGLDPVATQEMYDVIARLNREDGITVIMVSHDIGAAVRYASHILHTGPVPKFFGPKEEYLKTETGRLFTATAGGDGQ